MDFLGWSAETEEIPSDIMLEIVPSRISSFNKKYKDKKYSEDIDDLFIVFICTSEELQNDGFYKERKYVSHKNRFADMRLHVNYLEFISATYEVQVKMLYDTICRAAEIVSTRVKSFKKDEFIADLKTVFFEEPQQSEDKKI